MTNNTTYSEPTAAQPPGVVDKRPPFVMLSHELVLHIGNGRALLLYSILLSYANQTGRAHPSRETLAKHMGVKSTRTVDAALKDLEQLGLVSTFHRWHNEDRSRVALQADDVYKYQTSNGYILYDWAQRKPAHGGRTNVTPPGTQSSPPRGYDVAHKQEPVEQEPVEVKDLRASDDAQQRNDVDLFAAADTPKPQQPDLDAEFEQWWQHVPRKKSKGDARKAFRAARKRVPLQVLVDGMDASVAQWQREGRPADKVPYPATWLRGEGWEDQPDEWQQQVPQQPAQAPNPWAAYLDDQPAYAQEPRPDYAQGHTIIDDDWS